MIKEFRNEYEWLSNFYPVRIKLGNFIYPSVEHAYVSMKNDQKDWKLYCSRNSISASEVKHKGGKIELRDNWENIKIPVMFKCLKFKFKQEPLRTKLLNTGNEHIQEGNWWNDCYWGVCLKTGKGENNLGKMIMEIRKRLKYETN